MVSLSIEYGGVYKMSEFQIYFTRIYGTISHTTVCYDRSKQFWKAALKWAVNNKPDYVDTFDLDYIKEELGALENE